MKPLGLRSVSGGVLLAVALLVGCDDEPGAVADSGTRDVGATADSRPGDVPDGPLIDAGGDARFDGGGEGEDGPSEGIPADAIPGGPDAGDAGPADAPVQSHEPPSPCTSTAQCRSDQFCSQSRCISDVVEAGLGPFLGCAMHANGRVTCWGGTQPPREVAGVQEATGLAVGGRFACALVAGGRVLCWGNNDDGQLGNGTLLDDFTPRPVITDAGTVLTGMRIIAATNASFVCAAGDQLYCWGLNSQGQVGIGRTGEQQLRVPLATRVALDFIPRMVTVSLQHTFVHDGGSRLCGWGYNYTRQIVDTTEHPITRPTCWELPDVRQIAAGGNFTCALKTSGNIQCWSINNFGQLGVPVVDRGRVFPPPGVSPSTTRNYSQIVAAGYPCGVRAADSNVECWGFQETVSGQFDHEGRPVALPGPARSLFGGYGANCALLMDGSLHCWGANRYGQLGDGGTADHQRAPVAVRF